MKFNENKEIEVRFREIDTQGIQGKLMALGFEDCGEDLFLEVIFFDKELTWVAQRKTVSRYVRLRRTKKGVILTYKNHRQDIDTAEAQEIEFQVSNLESARDFLQEMGLVAYRTQEKKRHKFTKGNVVIDIDTWPQIPTYIEIEGTNEDEIKSVVEQLDLEWKNVTWENAGNLIEKYYGLMVSKMKFYTFDKVEYYEEK
jgi:adenylate cyclase, class 2